MCSAPLEPLCIGQDATFENEAATLRCRADLDRFVEQTREYLACLRTAARETEDGLDDVVNRFEERSGR